MVPAHALGRSDEHFERRIAGARTHSRQAGIDAIAPLLHRNDGVRDAQAEVVVRMHAGLGLGLEHVLECPEPVTHVGHAERAAGVDDIATRGAVAFHQPGLLRQVLR